MTHTEAKMEIGEGLWLYVSGMVGSDGNCFEPRVDDLKQTFYDKAFKPFGIRRASIFPDGMPREWRLRTLENILAERFDDIREAIETHYSEVAA